MIYTAGVDPGLRGFVCVLGERDDDACFREIPLNDDDFDSRRMSEIARALRGAGVSVVALEEQQAFPGGGPRCCACGRPKFQQGTASSFKGGMGFGIWLGVLAAAELRVVRVRPAVWKRSMGLSSDKSKSVEVARRLAPGVDFRPLERTDRARVPSHDKAEAYLLARYARKLLEEEK